MATSSKAPTSKAVKPTGKSSVKEASKHAIATTTKAGRSVEPMQVSKTPKPRTATEPSLRFFHSKALRDKTDTVLSALESRPDHSSHGDAIADLVSELVEAGMDYYFLKALKQAEVGFVGEQSARLGMSGAVKLISSVSRKFIVRMEPHQLLVVAAHIRSLTVTQ